MVIVVPNGDPEDSTIRGKFNTYKSTDYKEQVIYLIAGSAPLALRQSRLFKEMEETGEA